MKDSNQEVRRDEVLFAFHRECAVPTAAQIAEWSERYPEFADDIRAHAAIRRDWAADQSEEQVEEVLIARSRSRALNAIYNAQVAARSSANGAGAAGAGFEELMSARGASVRVIARDIDIKRTVIADLVAGRMAQPIGPRLVEAMTQQLRLTTEAFDQAVRIALGQPKLGMAKADGQPSVTARPYADIIRSSDMSDERKAYWLGED